ncbi:hypothetical protein RND81_11G036100 [Saponaria officinalis]|uniref:DUF3615 domain-containing protein n=1 Tax=Saponaria officinalis TaxID=3572 RepID=A0AAW1HJ53_SAPOF
MEIEKAKVGFKIGFPCDDTIDPRLGDPYKSFFPNGFDSDLDDEGAPKFELTINDVDEKNRKGIGNNEDHGDDLPYLNVVYQKWPLKYRKGHHKEIKELIDYKQREYRVLLRLRDINCANAAVEFYNKKHGTDYEIVETLGSYLEIFNGLLYHCNFRAQRKSVINSSPELFFAELLNKLDARSVKLCVIMDIPDPSHSLPRGCRICCGQLWHPVDYVI